MFVIDIFTSVIDGSESQSCEDEMELQCFGTFFMTYCLRHRQPYGNCGQLTDTSCPLPANFLTPLLHSLHKIQVSGQRGPFCITANNSVTTCSNWTAGLSWGTFSGQSTLFSAVLNIALPGVPARRVYSGGRGCNCIAFFAEGSYNERVIAVYLRPMKLLNFCWKSVLPDTKIFELIHVDIGTVTMGRDSAVGIVTRYGLDGPGIESRWGERFSAPVQTGPGAHPASCAVGTEPLSRG